ncbi:hypothetical protein [Actinoplanes sp. NPDC023714]|uniref:hypothetical protein n=1 Tax=Actinoplanes sp. NPDC023714 TaxID=3154322 RepID=UPI0033E59A46
MNATRPLAGLAALTAVALGLTGCGSSSSDSPSGTAAAAPSASATPAPAEELLASIPDEKVAAYVFASSGACYALTGVLDAPGKAISTKISEDIPEVGGSLTMSFLAFGAEKPYAKFAIKPAAVAEQLGVGKSWYAADPAELTDFADSPLSYNDETDPLGAGVLIGTATDVARSGDGVFTGTADLSEIAAAHPVLKEEEVEQLGDKAKSVPFEATVDAKSGHLAELAVKIPSAGKVKGGTCTIAYTGYDATKALTEPAAGDVKKATANVYDLLNS